MSVSAEVDAPARRLDQPRDAARDRRLARARFADDAQRLAAPQHERRRRSAATNVLRRCRTRLAARVTSCRALRVASTTGAVDGRALRRRQARHRARSACGVYACCGRSSTSSRGPLSTTRPRCSTTTRSAISATTPKSCVMNSTPVPCCAATAADQREDLRLRGDVERGRRLVGDQQRGLEHQRHRDHDALALAAGELVRIRRDRSAPARADADVAHDRRAACARAARRAASRCASPAPRRSARRSASPD